MRRQVNRHYNIFRDYSGTHMLLNTDLTHFFNLRSFASKIKEKIIIHLRLLQLRKVFLYGTNSGYPEFRLCLFFRKLYIYCRILN